MKPKMRMTVLFSVCVIFVVHQLWAVGTSSSPYDHIIQRIAQKYDVDPVLVHSIIRAESNYNSMAVSSKGAVGLMQLMPETAKELGVMNPFDPEENIEGGVKLLKDLLETYNQKEDLALAAYNAGQEAVSKHKGIPPFSETIQYIKRIKSFWNPGISASGRTKIYSFRDKTGRLVITNDRNFYLRNKK